MNIPSFNSEVNMRRFALRLAAVFALSLSIVMTLAGARAHAELTKISDSVYAYVDVKPETPGNVFCANVGVIIGTDAVLVVDTLTSAKEAEMLLADIRTITDKPVRYVVDTHYHLDHSLGNCVFADQGATIIGHEKCRAALLQTGEGTLQNAEAFGLPQDFWEGTRIKAPDLTFASRMEIDLGGVVAQVLYGGYPTHSPDNCMVILPDQGIIFTGDILFTNFHAFLGEGDLEGWAKTLDMIADMDVRTIIPGHGPVSDKDDLADMKEYLVLFDTNAKELSAAMDDPQQIVAEMLKRLPKLEGGEFIVGMNIMTRYKPQAQPQE